MSDTGPGNSIQLGSVAACISVVAISGADCFTQLNLSILYAIPLVAIGRTSGAARLALLTGAFVNLTFLGYVIKTTWALENAPPLVSYRMLNRSLVAAILVLTATELHAIVRRRRDRPEGDDFDRLLDSLRPVLVILLSAFAAVAILAADLITPGELNVPILYGAPIVLIAAAGSDRLIWWFASVLAVLSLLGYLVGPAPDVAPGFLRWAIVNRTLAVCVVFVLAFFLRSTRPSHPTNSPTP
jgi:hypothetical protein